ncbi:hypothetical protein [Serratia silvae]|uniref:Uncharacterized protein n=1 Tax=Serratia silvae TaxID=2824122 RepID=A0ABT0K8H0_9GAMM|nr:hypothetical protein [Serratia silvae]MCL1027838.1 hypothetical protein [Serratia silvae]
MMKIVFLCALAHIVMPATAAEVELNALGRLNPVPHKLPDSYASGYYASKDTYGMRSSAVVAAFMANSRYPFDFPIIGIPYVKSLAYYQNRDSVGLYADNTAPKLKEWEVIKSGSFTPTSFTSKEVDAVNIKPGMIIDTMHNPKWSSYVVSVSEGKIITAGWVSTKTKRMGTPTNDAGITINPITKIWATNFNMFLPENGRAKMGVIQENAIVNNIEPNPKVINGIDTVVLPISRYGGTAAYLSRSAVSGFKQQWIFGFLSQGNNISFASANTNASSPKTSFLESSSADDGLLFEGKNKNSSVLWKDGKRVVSVIGPKGLIEKIGYKTAVAKTSMQLSDRVGRYLISPDGEITLTLPKKESVFAGYTMKLMKVSPSDSVVVFKSPDSNVNGASSAKISGGPWNKEAVFDGTYWYIY